VQRFPGILNGVFSMNEQSPAQGAVEIVAAALRKKEEENGHLEPVLRAFGRTVIEQARWKATLKDFDCHEIAAPDPERFAKGIPLADRARLARLGTLWPTAADRIIPSLAEGFPKIREWIERLRTAIMDGGFSPDLFLGTAYGGRKKEAGEIAGQIGVEPEILQFVLAQLAKPVVEKQAQALQPLIDGLAWNRGYCPICGSFPEMSLLRGKEGQRWLRCGFCACAWRFYRMSCPFCDTRKPGDSEIFFVEGREHERAEVCHKCGRYITGIDLRNFADEGVLEIMAIGLTHLDVIAQEKGFLPMKGIGWQGLDETCGGNRL